MVVDNLIPDHVELTHVLDLAVHLVNIVSWDYFTIVVAYAILVSAQVPNGAFDLGLLWVLD